VVGRWSSPSSSRRAAHPTRRASNSVKRLPRRPSRPPVAVRPRPRRRDSYRGGDRRGRVFGPAGRAQTRPWPARTAVRL